MITYIILLLVFFNQIAVSRHLQIQPSSPTPITISEIPRLRRLLDSEISFTSNWKKNRMWATSKNDNDEIKVCCIIIFPDTDTEK